MKRQNTTPGGQNSDQKSLYAPIIPLYVPGPGGLGVSISALDDLKRHLSRNGYPRGIISYNMNDVVSKQRNKTKDIIRHCTKKRF